MNIYINNLGLTRTEGLKLTSCGEIIEIMRAMPNNKAPGPDGVHNRHIKNLQKKKALVLVVKINNACLIHIYFPAVWKKAKIIPIVKPGKPAGNPSSYRPISLLSVPGKLLERVIHKRLALHSNKILIDEQFGFRPGHSTVQQVTRITYDISEKFNENKVTGMLLLDVERAFDRVWLDGLLHKIAFGSREPATPLYLLSIIQSFLSGRTFQVAVGGKLSTVKNIPAGVPQGSVLAPTLFARYINDIPKMPRTKLALFADDTALYADSWCAAVAFKKLQIHMDEIWKFFEKWKIKINADKCESIIFHKKVTGIRPFQPLTISEHKIPIKSTVKYLGVNLDAKLLFENHIKKSAAKASGVIRALYPLLARNSKLNAENKARLYKTVIRPVFTYAAPVWDCAAKKHRQCLQVVQNKCLRLALSEGRYARLRDLHEDTGTPMLGEYTRRITEKFYSTKLGRNPLLNPMKSAARQNLPYRIKHRLPHSHTDYFDR